MLVASISQENKNPIRNFFFFFNGTHITGNIIISTCISIHVYLVMTHYANLFHWLQLAGLFAKQSGAVTSQTNNKNLTYSRSFVFLNCYVKNLYSVRGKRRSYMKQVRPIIHISERRRDKTDRVQMTNDSWFYCIGWLHTHVFAIGGRWA